MNKKYYHIIIKFIKHTIRKYGSMLRTIFMFLGNVNTTIGGISLPLTRTPPIFLNFEKHNNEATS